MKPPFAALLVRPPREHGFTDSCGVSAVTVIALDEVNQQAECVERVGAQRRKFWTNFESLATSPAKAAAKLAPLISAVHRRAPKTALAVMTPMDGGSQK